MFLWASLAFTQNYPSKNYTAATDLPNNAVRSLLVDSNNVLWIGTENGVVKKENDIFTYFFEEDGLALNSCWAIAEDDSKQLWFGSYGEGVSIYDGARFKVVSQKDGLVHNEITKLFPFNNRMYVGTSDGVSIIDIKSHKVLKLRMPPNEELLRVQDFFEYKQEIYVATYRSGLFKILNKNDQNEMVQVHNQKYIYSILVDKDSIYSSNKGFFTKSKLDEYVKKKDTSNLQPYGSSIIWDHAVSRDHKIFAAAWGIFDSNGGIYELVNNSLVSRASDFNIFSKQVISMAYDPQFEKLYVGTKNEGLYEVKLNPQIKFHEFKGKNVLGFASSKDASVLLLDDAIIIKTENDDISINLPQLKKWQESYVLKTKNALPEHRDDFYELDYSTKAQDIDFYDIKVSNGIFWVNTNIGIFAINNAGELLRYLPLHSEEINFTDAGKLIETNPYGGVRVHGDVNNFKYTYFNPEEANTPTMVVHSLQRDTKTYLLSIFSGLYVWENNGFQSYLKDGIWAEKKLKHITSIGKNLAISNEFGDVFIINDEAGFKVLKKISRAKIQGNSITFLKNYKGRLLIGTEKGLTIFKDGRFQFLNEEQGLIQPLLNGQVKENKLYIGSKNGYYSIDLDDVDNCKDLVQELKLKDIFINNNPFPLDKQVEEGEINLAHDQNTILLKFSTNAHPYPHKLTYQYRIKTGENWSLPSSKSEIFLPFLPADNYNVAVKVLDQSTGFTYSQTLLQLAVLPPFWKTWWFIALLFGTLILIVYGIYSFQIRQNKEFEEQKGLIQKRFEETKMEALLSQMNPHFIFNAMNSIQNYIMDSDIDNASIFLGDFSKLIRLNLDHCTKPTILLIEEIEYLQSYIRVENTRFNNRIKVIFAIDPMLDVYEIEIPTMLLQTFVENVFVHAFPPSIANPTLKVSFTHLAENVLQCKIEDNGIGFSPNSTNKLHISKGVSLVKERLALLGYRDDKAIQVISSAIKGTAVTITLKV